MTYTEKAKEIYFDTVNAGRGFVSDFLAAQMALIVAQHCYEATKDNWWKNVISEIKKKYLHSK